MLRLMCMLSGLFLGVSSTKTKLPNFLVFLADDLGYGDLSCYGNTKVRTPNIDKLAAEGIKFTRMYAQPFCTPSRSTLLTGRFPPRVGMSMSDHFGFPVLATLASNAGLRPKDLTIPRLLQKRGYKNAAIGKWHLGHGQNGVYLPNQVGFESFYGIPLSHLETCSSYMPCDTNMVFKNVLFAWRKSIITFLLVAITLRLKFINNKLFFGLLLLFISPFGFLRLLMAYAQYEPATCILYRDSNIIEQPYKDENMTLRTTVEVLRVLEEAHEEERPFFIYMSFLSPHVPGISSKYFSGSTGSGPYYDSVAELDWSVGRIMEKLKELGFDDNTLVYFASDNGPQDVSLIDMNTLTPEHMGSAGYAEDTNGKKHKLRGWKGETYEGGIRVPGIMRWKGKLPTNVESSGLTGLQDLFPTIAELTSQTESLKSYFLDGKSLLPLLRKPETNKHHEFMFHWCTMEQVSAVSHGDYKLHLMSGHSDCNGAKLDPPELYDMNTDPGENTPLNLDDYKGTVDKIMDALKKHEQTMEDPNHGRLGMTQIAYPPIPWQFPCANDDCKLDLTETEDFSSLGLS